MAALALVIDRGEPHVESIPTGSFSLRLAVTEALSRLARDQSRLISLLVVFDRSGEWANDGAWSCAQWVAERADLELSTISEWLRIGRRLVELDEIAAQFRSGQLSYSKVRALVRVATRENQHELCAIARRVPASKFAEALAKWLLDHETEDETERRQRASTGLRWRTEPDGMVVASWRLPPGQFAPVGAAIDSRVMNTQRGRSASADGKRPRKVAIRESLAQQRADALLELVTGGGATISTEVILHVRGDGCTLDNGAPIAGSIVERLVPQAFLRALIHDAERHPINASGRHRHPTDRQRRVVKERDRNCVDCGSGELLHYDHEPPFEKSKRTVVDELELRCAPCHRARHERLKRRAAA
jgi:hypothetical protein